MSSRIEQIIEEIEEYIDSCRFQPLSSTKIVVNKEELEQLLRELRMKTPDEIKRYQKIISNKDAILEDAQQKADAIIADAQARADRIVSESEVMKRALDQSRQLLEQTNAQAQEMIDNATTDSNNIRMGAMSYTDEVLANLQSIMEGSLSKAGETFNEYMGAMKSTLDTVTGNRAQLQAQVGGSYQQQPQETEEQPAAEEDEEA